MKKFSILLSAAFLLCSCSTLYYQIATVGSNQGKLTKDNSMVFTDGNYVLAYDFWAESGQVSFVFSNESDKDVYVDLSRSFLFVNGMTNDYFKNRTWTSTSGGAFTSSSSESAAVTGRLYKHPGIVGTLGASTAVSGTVMSSSSVETKEKEGVWVPAHSSRHFCEFQMMDAPYRECSFHRFPSSPVYLDFSEETSPYVYNNRLMLIVDGEDRLLDNTFFIKSLMNASEKNVVIYSYPKDCKGNQVGNAVRTITAGGSNKFYNKYVIDNYGNDMTAKSGATSFVEDFKSSDRIVLSKDSGQPYKIVYIAPPVGTYHYTMIELESELPMPKVKDVSVLSNGQTIKCLQKVGPKKYLFNGELALPFLFVISGENSCSIKVERR